MTPAARKYTKRAYSVGIKLRPDGRRNLHPKTLMRSILVEYGSFTGALIGALGTILAGGAAWIGAQDQILQQRAANVISEAVFIRSELDKVYAKKAALYRVQSNLTQNLITQMALSQVDHWHLEANGKIREGLRYRVNKYVTMEPQLVDDLRRGVAGLDGMGFLPVEEILSRIKSTIADVDEMRTRGADQNLVKIQTEIYNRRLEEYRLAIFNAMDKAPIMSVALKETDNVIFNLEQRLRDLNSKINH